MADTNPNINEFLKGELKRLDARLMKPSFWETPRGVALIIAATAAVAAPLGFFVGWELAR